MFLIDNIMNRKQLERIKEAINKSLLNEFANTTTPEIDVPSPKETPSDLPNSPSSTQDTWQPPAGNRFPVNLPRFSDIPNYYNPATGEAIYILWGPPVQILYEGLDSHGNPYYRTVQEIQQNDPNQFYNKGYRWIITIYNQDGTPRMTSPQQNFSEIWSDRFNWDKPNNTPNPAIWDTTNPGWTPGPWDPWDEENYSPHYPSNLDPWWQEIQGPPN